MGGLCKNNNSVVKLLSQLYKKLESETNPNKPIKNYPYPMRHSLSTNVLFQKIQ